MYFLPYFKSVSEVVCDGSVTLSKGEKGTERGGEEGGEKRTEYKEEIIKRRSCTMFFNLN